MTAAERLRLTGPAGELEAVLSGPAEPALAAVVSHPHPLYGGTMDNLVVLETERALARAGAAVLRFNFRGVGASQGEHDGGDGERFDLAAAIAALRERRPELPLLLAGYSFGAIATLSLLADPGLRPDGCSAVLLLAPPVAYAGARRGSAGGARVAVIYGERDDLTPATALTDQAATWSDRRSLFPVAGAGHDLGTFGDPSALRLALSEALRFLLAPAEDAAAQSPATSTRRGSPSS